MVNTFQPSNRSIGNTTEDLTDQSDRRGKDYVSQVVDDMDEMDFTETVVLGSICLCEDNVDDFQDLCTTLRENKDTDHTVENINEYKESLIS